MNNHSIDIISIEDKEYPSLLKKIDNPPICIYIIGRKDILNDTNIAIVGSRDATEYGKYEAKDFAYPIYWFQEEEILQDVHSLLVSYIPAVY